MKKFFDSKYFLPSFVVLLATIALFSGQLLGNLFSSAYLTSQTPVVFAQEDTCPGEEIEEELVFTPGWHKIDSDDLDSYPVEGASDYCFKAGSSNSQGCTGGLFDEWPPNVQNYCGLSHWSYFIGEEQEIEDLQLTSVCSVDPEETRRWRVRNTNDFEVDFDWEVYPNQHTGSDTAPASGDGVIKYEGATDGADYMFFETPTVEGDNTVKIYWDGGEATKASGGVQCEIESSPSPSPTVLGDVCANIDGVQTSVPEGLHLGAAGENCVAFELGGAPTPPEAEGEVLGAQSGQVLGLSDTSSSNPLNTYLFWTGLVMLTVGVKLTGDYLYARNRS